MLSNNRAEAELQCYYGENLVVSYFSGEDSHVESNDYHNAIEKFTNALKQDSTFIDAYIHRGMVYRQLYYPHLYPLYLQNDGYLDSGSKLNEDIVRYLQKYKKLDYLAHAILDFHTALSFDREIQKEKIKLEEAKRIFKELLGRVDNSFLLH